MSALVEYMVLPLVRNPDDVQVSVVEGNSSVLIELRVHPDDVDRLQANDGARFRAMQQVLSASGGDRKAVLELIEPDNGGEE